MYYWRMIRQHVSNAELALATSGSTASKPVYHLMSGSAVGIICDPFMLTLPDIPRPRLESIRPGVTNRGNYGSERAGILPVGSFMYFKNDKTGALEVNERLIIITGMGYGVHPDHAGQPESEYLIGAQIGVIEADTRKPKLAFAMGELIVPKNFSVSCIVGAVDCPILANPS